MSKFHHQNGVEQFETDVYSKLDDLFFDKKTEYYIQVNDSYIKESFQKYLSDNNFNFVASDKELNFVFVSASEGTFKFIEEPSEKSIYLLPEEWNLLTKEISDYIKDNPVEKKLPTPKNPENWNIPASQQKTTSNNGGFVLVETDIDEETKKRMEKVYAEQAKEREERGELGQKEVWLDTVTNITEPKSLVVLGTLFNDTSDIEITDDYSSLNFRIDNEKIKLDRWGGIETDGFATIITVSQFQEFLNKWEEEMGETYNGDHGFEAALISNFSGKIEIGAQFEDGTYASGFNYGDYIQHQLEDYADVFINLPEGTKIEKINEGNLMALLRERKIDDILEDKNENKNK